MDQIDPEQKSPVASRYGRNALRAVIGPLCIPGSVNNVVIELISSRFGATYEAAE